MVKKKNTSIVTLETLRNDMLAKFGDLYAKISTILELSIKHTETLKIHEEQLKNVEQKLLNKVDESTDKIDLKIDTLVRVINDHYLKQGIKIEKLEEIHPGYTHVQI